jgi:hypothetical protein
MMTLGTSKADTERAFTIRQDIVCTHWVNYGTEALLARLRMHYIEAKDQSSDESDLSDHGDHGDHGDHDE